MYTDTTFQCSAPADEMITEEQHQYMCLLNISRMIQKYHQTAPFRVRLRSSVPRTRSSWLHTPKKLFSSSSERSLMLLPLLSIFRCSFCKFCCLGWCPPPPPPIVPFSTGITAAMFHTSFKALALSVAAPLNAASNKPYNDYLTQP